ncbi:hypothetical protein GCM10009634_55150 [Saccharothrix xinjiangensis]
MLRRFLATTSVAALLTAAATGSAAPALATPTGGPLAVICLGTEATLYNPGVVLLPRVNTFAGSGTYGPCLGLGAGPASGTTTLSGTGTFSCLAGIATGQQTLNWSDGTSSQISFTALSVRPAGESVLIFSGTVTSGRYEGAAVTRAIQLLTSDITACLTTGITELAGPTELAFTRLA